MFIHQLILHGCSNALHLEMDFDPNGSVTSTRTSKGSFDQQVASPADIVTEESYWLLYMLGGNDWKPEALRQAVSSLARTRSNPFVRPLVRQGDMTLIDLDRVFFDPLSLEGDEVELFSSQSMDCLTSSISNASQMGFAVAIQADPYTNTMHRDVRFVYQDARTGMWYVIFWGINSQFEQVFFPKLSAFPEMPPIIAPFLATLL